MVFPADDIKIELHVHVHYTCSYMYMCPSEGAFNNIMVRACASRTVPASMDTGLGCILQRDLQHRHILQLLGECRYMYMYMYINCTVHDVHCTCT